MFGAGSGPPNELLMMLAWMVFAAVFSAVVRSANALVVAWMSTILHLRHRPRTDSTSSAVSVAQPALLPVPAAGRVVPPVWFTTLKLDAVSAGIP